MQFENFDDKVKQAAEQHHPNYDEKAWAKMEKLLDRHLPQENDRRRRIIFFILLFLLVGGGIFTIYKIRQPENTVSAFTNTTPVKAVADPSVGSVKEVTEQPTSPADVAKSSINKPQQDLVNQPVTTEPSVTGNNKPDPATTPIINKPAGLSKQVLVKNQSQQDAYQIDVDPGTKSKKVPATTANLGKTQITNNNPVVSTSTTNTPQGNDAGDKTAPQTVNTDPAVVTNNESKVNKDNKSTDPSTSPVKNETVKQPEPAVEKSVTKKSPGKKRSGFFLSASGGPDVSSVATYKPGKVEILGGAGFGYAFGRWSVRTGFYTARKIYSAGKGSYKPSFTIPNSNYLDEVNADCRVYEIPLSVAYNFSESKKGNWFASAGLSSYIMKKEDYQYVYTFPNMPQPVIYNKVVENENKHYFSVLGLSAGYQRKISNTVSLSAEPYIKIPLTGIGLGNVKLKSAGVLVSLNVNLFQSASVK